MADSSGSSFDSGSYVSSICVGMSDYYPESEDYQSSDLSTSPLEENIAPYQFEPEYLAEELEQVEIGQPDRQRGNNENEEVDRVRDLSW